MSFLFKVFSKYLFYRLLRFSTNHIQTN
jgi:hypothetical protein